MRANGRGKVASMWASWTRLVVVAQRTIAALLAGIAWSSWSHRSYIKVSTSLKTQSTSSGSKLRWNSAVVYMVPGHVCCVLQICIYIQGRDKPFHSINFAPDDSFLLASTCKIFGLWICLFCCATWCTVTLLSGEWSHDWHY
jgi:hypothetical protein